MKNNVAISFLVMFILSACPVFADGLIVLPDPVKHLNTSFPLAVKYHHVTVTIRGQHAVTDIDQEFYNPNRNVLSGEYIFPVPKNAAINKFSVLVNGREVRAELLDAQKARDLYRKILKQQREPALLEYEGMDLFRAKIPAINPRSSKRVRIVYGEILTPENQTYEYLYPLNTEKFSSHPLEAVSITVNIENSDGIKNIFSTSHEIITRQTSTDKAVARYEAKNVKPDRDFRLFFSTSPSKVSFSLLSYREKKDAGYFLLSLSPGMELSDSEIVKKDISFVLDTSGSMMGEKLEKARRALRYCIDNLNPGDRFRIIGFSTEVDALFSSPSDANPANRKKAHEFIDGLEANGGTNISGALEEALKIRSERPHIVLFITDGKPTIGITEEDALLKSIGRRTTVDTRIFTFGIGYDINTHLLDRITALTRSSRSYITPDEDIEMNISSFYRKIQSPVLMNPVLIVKGVRFFKSYPTTLPDLYRGSSITVLGRYAGSGKAVISLEGVLNGKKRSYEYTVNLPERETDNDYIAALWAARRIGYLLEQIRLSGETSQMKNEVVLLAREHGIITPYTTYLIHQDERTRIARRELTDNQLTLGAMEEESEPLIEQNKHDYLSMKKKSGSGSVMASREVQNLKNAMNYSQARQGKSRLTYRDASGNQRNLAQQVKNVQGRAVYNAGRFWVDAMVQSTRAGAAVKILFGSVRYFKLLKDHPESAKFLSLGRNVRFVLKGVLYEVHE